MVAKILPTKFILMYRSHLLSNLTPFKQTNKIIVHIVSMLSDILMFRWNHLRDLDLVITYIVIMTLIVRYNVFRGN